ncbi:NAD(P)-dependent oxidoreductase [Geodermatophilus nigrescens]
MHVTVFGASGGVGHHVVRRARERGHEVTAVARQVPDGGGAGWLAGDVRDPGLARAAVADADAVLWCVGVTRRSGGDVGRAALPGVLAAMAAAGVARFVGVSGAGADLPGDDKGRGARLVSALTHRLAGAVVADKEAEHRLLAASPLQWTQVRPPRLTDRPCGGSYRLSDRAPGLRVRPVPRDAVARAMLDLAEGRHWVQAAPFLVVDDGPAAGGRA